MTATLTDLRRYPVKSCRGESVATALVEPWGLAGDRRWMLVDAAGAAVTARQANALVLVRPEITATGLRLEAPGAPPLEVVTPAPDPVAGVRLFRDDLVGTPAAAEAGAWFSEFLGRQVDLLWCDDPTRRQADPRYAEPDDVVSYADGYPLLLTTEESLAALDDAAPGGPLSMTRFRPNVVVSGHPAWAEDDWRRVRIGEATFRSVKACARCVLTTVDPETGRRGAEPLATLARIRRRDGATWFGVNLVPDSPGAVLRVGDDVEVLDAGDGPPVARP